MVPKNDDENFHYSFATKFCKYVSNAFTSDIEAKKIFKDFYIYVSLKFKHIRFKKML